VSRAEDTLLLAEEPWAGPLSSWLGAGGLSTCAEAYDALEQMARRRLGTIVLTAPRADFAGLCRASRRLQRDCGLFAVCTPAAEMEIRPLAGEVLDDYFIYPPTRADLARVERSASPVSEAVAAADGAVSPGPMAELIEAAESTEALEARLADLVARRIGVELAWADADSASSKDTALLLAAGRRPRVLAAVAHFEPDDSQRRFLSALQRSLPALMKAARRTESLRHLAITDHLTGAYNRRYFYHMTDRILARAGAKGFRATLLLYDIDNFKRYNDTYGYAAGDEILRQTVELIKQVTRGQDIVARIGGDEFAVLFRDVEKPRTPGSQPPQTAFTLADRFRRAVETHEFPSLGAEAVGSLTISGGLANFPADGRNCRELLRKADQAIKRAKSSGKNAIRIVGGD